MLGVHEKGTLVNLSPMSRVCGLCVHAGSGRSDSVECGVILCDTHGYHGVACALPTVHPYDTAAALPPPARLTLSTQETGLRVCVTYAKPKPQFKPYMYILYTYARYLCTYRLQYRIRESEPWEIR